MKMERAKVIVHMFVTIDGKSQEYLEGDPDARFAGEVYDQFVLTLGEAWGCGRNTFDSHRKVALPPCPEHDREDRLSVEKRPFCVAIDRMGKLRWNKPTMKYGPASCPIVEVLTERAPNEALAYYDSVGVSYLFAGKEEFDPELMLEKLKQKLGVNTFLLCGGASINAVFLKADLVDEISLIIAPGVSGEKGLLTSFDGEGRIGKSFALKEAKAIGHNTVLLRYVRKGEEAKK